MGTDNKLPFYRRPNFQAVLILAVIAVAFLSFMGYLLYLAFLGSVIAGTMSGLIFGLFMGIGIGAYLEHRPNW